MRRLLLFVIVGAVGMALYHASPARAVNYPLVPGPLAVTGGAGTPANPLTPGATVHVAGGGFAPGSIVEISFHSTPILVATVRADATGSIDTTVSVPGGLASGQHTIEAVGPAPGGGTVILDQNVTVVGGSAPAQPGPLATTGADVGTWVGFGIFAILLGGAVLVVGQRRKTN